MDLLYTFSDSTTQTSDFVLSGAKLTECFHNNLQSVDNSLSVKVPFNETLCDKLKADISNNIKVQMRDDSQNNIFTGYVRKTLTFSKTQRNQPFSLEVVPPSFLLDYDYSGTAIRIENTTVKNILTSIIGLTSYAGSIDVSEMGTETMEIFTLNDGDNILSVIKELLYEYCYVFNFDEDGNFVVSPLFADVPSSITQHFDGTNCLNQIQQQVKDVSYSQVAVNWTKVENKSGVLIFEDTTGADSNNAANIEIGATSYYLGEEHNYLEYDSKYQSVLWITSATPTITYDDSSTITSSFTNYGTKGDLSIYNSSSSSRYITKLIVEGSGYFEIATNTNKTGSSGGNLCEVDAKYIQATAYASNLAKSLKDYYAYANFSITVQSKEAYAIGSYCDVSDAGMGTVTCRIIRRDWNIQSNTYVYALESISAYDPAETVTSISNSRSRSDNGETLRSAVADLNDKVDNIVVDTTICSADRTQAIIELDEDGNTIAAQDISTTISLRQSSEELDFSIGAMSLPDGWTYTISDKTITFHIGEGVSVRSGQFLIPVIYRPIYTLEPYVDENGEAYVDENGDAYYNVVYSSSYTQWKLYFTYFGNNGGIYLGVINSVAEIPSSLNYGDYFVWGGDDTESTLSYDGEFLKSRVYSYIGTGKTWQWEADDSVEHCSVALGDILGIANSDLSTNNSTAYEYLDHLTSNSIFTDLLVANTAYIESLSAQLISVGTIPDEIYSTLGVDTLADYTLISGGYIKTSLIDVDTIKTTILTAQNIQAISGVFNNISVLGSIEATDLNIIVTAGDIILRDFGDKIVADDQAGVDIYSQIIASGSVRVKFSAYQLPDYEGTSWATYHIWRLKIYRNDELMKTYYDDDFTTTETEYSIDINISEGDNIRLYYWSHGGGLYTQNMPVQFKGLSICTNANQSILAYLGEWKSDSYISPAR